MAAQTIGIVFIASVLRGLTGFGFALAAVPMLATIMEPAQAVPISMCVVAFGGIFGARKALATCDWPSVRSVGLATAIGTPLGAFALKYLSGDIARVVIAAFTTAAVFSVARQGSPAARPGRLRAVALGLVAGLFNGLAAMPGPPVVAYYMATALSSEAIRSSLLVIFQVTVWVGAASAAALGLMTQQTFLLAGLSLPAFWLGNRLGHVMFQRGSERAYRRIALACLVAMAAASAIPAIRALLRASAASG